MFYHNIKSIALVSFKEVTRHKFFYGIIGAAFFIVGISLILGPLSMSEQERIAINFGLFGVQIVVIAISIFFGSLSITKDLERKALMTLLSKPVTRPQYILGKFIGVSITSFISVVILGAFICGLFYFIGIPLQFVHFVALWGIYLESLVILSISILFSTFTTPFLIVTFSISIFIIGHWIDTVKTLASEEGNGLVSSFLINYGSYILPNLEKFNWRSHAVYQNVIAYEEVIFYSFYALSWVIFSMVIAINIFNKKDIV